MITLGIIGVVAAMTISVLISEYQKTQYVVALKKFYTNFNQALVQMAVDNGTQGDISDYFSSDIVTTGDRIVQYFKIDKNCQNNVGSGCFMKYNQFYDGSGTGAQFDDWDNDSAKYKFITADGASIAIKTYANSCSQNFALGFNNSTSLPTYRSCGAVYIDVNGAKGPNYQGRDNFIFLITSNKTPMLYPGGGFYFGSTTVSSSEATGGANYWNYTGAQYCGGNAFKSGFYCAGRIIEKNWAMDY